MREADLEDVFRRAVRAAGGMAVKLTPPPAGIPDRLVLWPGARLYFVELKTKTGRLSVVQRVQHRQLAALGFDVVVLYGAGQIRAWAKEQAR